MSDTRWRCPACNDDMPPKFERSHTRICAAFTRLEAAQIDTFLEELGFT